MQESGARSGGGAGRGRFALDFEAPTSTAVADRPRALAVSSVSAASFRRIRRLASLRAFAAAAFAFFSSMDSTVF